MCLPILYVELLFIEQTFGISVIYFMTIEFFQISVFFIYRLHLPKTKQNLNNNVQFIIVYIQSNTNRIFIFQCGNRF